VVWGKGGPLRFEVYRYIIAACSAFFTQLLPLYSVKNPVAAGYSVTCQTRLQPRMLSLHVSTVCSHTYRSCVSFTCQSVISGKSPQLQWAIVLLALRDSIVVGHSVTYLTRFRSIKSWSHVPPCLITHSSSEIVPCLKHFVNS
jgi:hypothetical protein